MIRAYIDFDSTLYDTDIVKKKIQQVFVDGICKSELGRDKNSVLQEIKDAERNEYKSIFKRCKFFEEKYSLESGCISSELEKFLESGSSLMFEDSIPFLKRLSQKDFEVNILTYSIQENFDYQMKKIMGAGVLDYVDNIIICSKPKGELGLDYENGYFFDDNPRELESLSKAGVLADRLFRIRRIGSGYSNIEIRNFQTNEHSDFSDIVI